MEPQNPVLVSTRFVAKNARHVKINQESVRNLASWIKTSGLWINELENPAQTRDIICAGNSPKEKLEFLFILDSINFCFWSDTKKWSFTYGNHTYFGSIASAYALKQFFEKKPQKATLRYMASVSYKEFCSVFEGDGTLLLMKERWHCVQELCKTLLERYEGDVVGFVESAHQKASSLLNKIYLSLPYFVDRDRYEELYGEQRRVWFLKRAQLLIADIWSVFDGKGIGYFKDIDYLTALADYKLPQILSSKKYFGVLEYAPALEEKIKNKIELGPGSKEEVEIRACTIQAVENIVKEIVRLGGLKHVYPIAVDWMLWHWSHQDFDMPHHRTRGIDY